MGIFCSYYMENNISRLRSSIMNNQVTEMKAILKGAENSMLISKALKASIDSEIDNLGNTPLLFSIEHRKIESFRYILTDFNPNVDQGNHYTNLRPLHCLALSKVQSGFKEDLEQKASVLSDVSFVESVSGKPDSFFGIEIGHSFNPIDEKTLVEMIWLLVEKGADVNSLVGLRKQVKLEDTIVLKNITPLVAAVLANNHVATSELIKAGCNCDYQESTSNLAAIHIICKLARKELATALIETGDANLNLKSKNGYTCMHWLARSKKDNTNYIFQLIMDQLSRTKSRYHNEEVSMSDHLKNFIDQVNVKKQTALMLAASNNHQNLVKCLLDFNASTELKDENDMTAMDHAGQNSCAQLINSFKTVQEHKGSFSNRPKSELVEIHDLQLKDLNKDFELESETDP